jgi:hypothetical protein
VPIVDKRYDRRFRETSAMTVLIATFVIWLLVIPITVVAGTLALSTFGARRLAGATRDYAGRMRALPATVLPLRPAEPLEGAGADSLTA